MSAEFMECERNSMSMCLVGCGLMEFGCLWFWIRHCGVCCVVFVFVVVVVVDIEFDDDAGVEVCLIGCLALPLFRCLC